MKTTTIFAVIAIISAVGIAGTTIGTGILLSQQAHAAGCQTFVDSSGTITKEHCSSSHGKNPSTNLNTHFTK